MKGNRSDIFSDEFSVIIENKLFMDKFGVKYGTMNIFYAHKKDNNYKIFLSDAIVPNASDAQSYVDYKHPGELKKSSLF